MGRPLTTPVAFERDSMSERETSGAAVAAELANAVGWRDFDAALSSTAVFDAIANRERRLLLRYLHECEFMVLRADAAEQVAAWERDADREAVGADERKRVEVRLQHDHLPRLRDADIVDYDERSGMVALTDAGESVAERVAAAEL